MANKYWNIAPLWNTGATYMLAFGMRSNGKTYGSLKKGLELFAASGCQMAIIRRWADDFKGKRGDTLFSPLVQDGVIENLFEGEYNTIVYKSMQWFLAKKTENETIICSTPIAYAFPLTAMQHDKSSSYPNVLFVIFDEFLSRDGYLPNEFDLFTNTISTIVRDKEDVRVLMLGNTVSQQSPYFSSMGLVNIKNMEIGTIDTYTLGEHDELKIAVEYCETAERSIQANKYFAFNRQGVRMITSGSWEFDIYPRLHEKYKPSQIKFSAFVEYDNVILQMDIIKLSEMFVLMIHPKTTPIKDYTKDIVYNLEFVRPNKNLICNILVDENVFSKKILDLIVRKHVFYSDNQTGEIIRSWLQESKQNAKIIK